MKRTAAATTLLAARACWAARLSAVLASAACHTATLTALVPRVPACTTRPALACKALAARTAMLRLVNLVILLALEVAGVDEHIAASTVKEVVHVLLKNLVFDEVVQDVERHGQLHLKDLLQVAEGA